MPKTFVYQGVISVATSASLDASFPIFAALAQPSIAFAPIFAASSPIFAALAPISIAFAPIFAASSPIFAALAPTSIAFVPIFAASTPNFAPWEVIFVASAAIFVAFAASATPEPIEIPPPIHPPVPDVAFIPFPIFSFVVPSANSFSKVLSCIINSWSIDSIVNPNNSPTFLIAFFLMTYFCTTISTTGISPIRPPDILWNLNISWPSFLNFIAFFSITSGSKLLNDFIKSSDLIKNSYIFLNNSFVPNGSILDS